MDMDHPNQLEFDLYLDFLLIALMNLYHAREYRKIYSYANVAERWAHMVKAVFLVKPSLRQAQAF